MAKMPGVPFVPALNTSGQFAGGRPIGLVLHRTEGRYDHILRAWTVGPNPDRSSAHFLVGKQQGQVVQLVDTTTVANHSKGDANILYLGIEFESIPTSRVHGQDPATNRDPLTRFQREIGARIVDWISQVQRIPLDGPPSKRAMVSRHGRWHGVLSHNDLSDSGLFRTNHGDEIRFSDFIALGVFPTADSPSRWTDDDFLR